MHHLTQVPIRRVATRATAGALIAATLVMAGCAAFKTETPEEIVAQRVQARWQALIKHDFATAYSYTQPGYRAIVSEKKYEKTFGDTSSWESVDIFKTTCEAEPCTVRLRLTARNPVPRFSRSLPEIQGFIDETWIKDQGQWWFYQSLGK
jgi:hypothetical protein